QALPFQNPDRLVESAEWTGPVYPTVTQFVADRHETSWKNVDFPLAGAGTGRTFQALPFHTAAAARPALRSPFRFIPRLPTATQYVFDAHETPMSWEFPVPFGQGTVAIVQDLPVHLS